MQLVLGKGINVTGRNVKMIMLKKWNRVDSTVNECMDEIKIDKKDDRLEYAVEHQKYQDIVIVWVRHV